jgi:hypothetical protein
MKSGTLFGANVITAGLNRSKGGAETLLDPLRDLDKYWHAVGLRLILTIL